MNTIRQMADRANARFAAPMLEDERAATDTIHAEFAEPLVIRPMRRRANFPAEPDPSRPVVAVRGVFDLEPSSIKVGHEGLAVATFDPTCHIAKSQLPYAISRGDVIERTATGHGYEVTRSRPTTYSSVSLDLSEIGRARPFDEIDTAKGEVVAAETVRKATPRRGWGVR